ncbi:tRNA lysidine(34) synthetase TilS [Rhodopirellula halodulae]|uniref:tRNA lysidine(34) synthetase TilS n=1 Tax=Rhodopirellula halodulae TaxID=2894198 RepID=UPI001E61944A|nr:tRNA lysidine(34) synthetase TilS [Rhodopirellula sp. JC737]MCC9657440.1 tRNA lysidine(34) synthetase TilS [Rhodopirellula sp. JC737]
MIDQPTAKPRNDSSKWQLLRQAIRASWINRHGRAADVGTVIGCSGGADSVALARLLVELWNDEAAEAVSASGGSRTPKLLSPLVIAHCNHGLRGDESNADESFVRNLSETLGVTCVVHREVNTSRLTNAPPARDESTLRNIRRKFFHEVAQQHGCRYIAVAHTADDQAETLLHHFLRGTGPRGMGGMTSTSPFEDEMVLRRPLLSVRRKDLREGLREIAQSWREDASNQQTLYTRNWIRQDVLPMLEERYPTAVDAMVRTGQLQSETNSMVDRFAQRWLDECTRFTPSKSTPDRWTIFAEAMAARSSNAETNAGKFNWHQERPIIVAACQLAWDQLGWSRGVMTMDHWQRLASTILELASREYDPSEPTSFNGGPLPGPISLRNFEGNLVLQAE